MNKCPKCGNSAEIDDLGTWPFACKRCVGKNFADLYRIQAESIKNWESTCTPRRTEPERRRWSTNLEAGFRKLGI